MLSYIHLRKFKQAKMAFISSIKTQECVTWINILKHNIGTGPSTKIRPKSWLQRNHTTIKLLTLCWLLIILLSRTIRAEGRITFVTSIKSFETEFQNCTDSHRAIVAINHWSNYFDETIVLADTANVCHALKNLHLKNVKCMVHGCNHPMFGKPIMKCLLQRSMDFGSNNIILFSNSDLIYARVRDAIRIARNVFSEFVIMGKRFDINFQELCQSMTAATGGPSTFPSANLEIIPGNFHDASGIDYFLFSRRTRLPLDKMPDFLIGVWKWDNWILDNMIRSGVNVIDATKVIRAVHLQSNLETHRNRSGSEHNKAMYQKFYNLTGSKHLLDDPFPVGYGSIDFCPFGMTEGRIIRRWCYLNLLFGSMKPLCNDP